MNCLRISLIVLGISILFLSCNKTIQPVDLSSSYYTIKDSLYVDSSLVTYIKPYKDSLENEMEEVLATVAKDLYKGRPESLLGNLIADLMLEKGTELYGQKVHISIMNYGGLRIPMLPQGVITKGKIFELMPFDNFFVIMELQGKTIKKLFDVIATDGGWPIGGARFIILNQSAEEIMIDNKPLDSLAIYNVAISDYLADGGDELFFLREEKRENLGIFLRDVFLDFFKEKTAEGIIISSQLDQRIVLSE